MPRHWESLSLNTQPCPGGQGKLTLEITVPIRQRDRGAQTTQVRSLHGGPARIQAYFPGLPHPSGALRSATCLCLPLCLLAVPVYAPQKPSLFHYSRQLCTPIPDRDISPVLCPLSLHPVPLGHGRIWPKERKAGAGASPSSQGQAARELGLVLAAPVSLHPQGPARLTRPAGSPSPLSSPVSPRSDPLLGPIIRASSSLLVSQP